MNPVFKFKVSAPSNIAFVKYWGKKNIQEPINPSLSMTLKNSVTITELEAYQATQGKDLELDFYFQGELNPDFAKRIISYIELLAKNYPQLTNYKYKIHSENNFAHSTGIASSASSYAALASCIKEFLGFLEVQSESVSSLARLGSGSAARSIAGPYMTWGKTNSIDISSDHQASKLESNKMPELSDLIILVDEAPKKVSSSQGHVLMDTHPYRAQRIMRANHNLDVCLNAFKQGDFKVLGQVIEAEALELHALMMTSEVPFWLLSAKTLDVMNWTQKTREESLPVYFTLDAGANVHLIVEKSNYNKLLNSFCKDFPDLKYIEDEQGSGVEVL